VNQKTELLNLRMEINDYISTNMVPSNILSKVSSVLKKIARKLVPNSDLLLIVPVQNHEFLHGLLDAS
jgi:hypothetical protein